jgi:hypothetical protein
MSSGGHAALSHFNPQLQHPCSDHDVLRLLFPHRFGEKEDLFNNFPEEAAI